MLTYRDFSYEAFRFIAGLTNDKPESDAWTLNRFIDWRSRVPELRQMKLLYPNIAIWRYKKHELIDFFCNLSANDRKKVLGMLPDMIIAMPADCKEFKLKERPRAIAQRSSSFSGNIVEYNVYSVVDFLKAVEKKESAKKSEEPCLNLSLN